MADVVVTYETLFDLLRKEKSRAELQSLTDDFYGHVVAYMQGLLAAIDEAGGASSAGAQKTLVQLKNTRKILQELYERRERKVIEMSLNRARAESNIVDTGALLASEEEFYNDFVTLLGEQKKCLLAPLLRGDVPDGIVVPDVTTTAEEEVASEAVVDDAPVKKDDVGMPRFDAIAAKESCSVRFTAPVPKFLGLQGEVHGPYEPGDTASLPGEIAVVLLKKKRVEVTE